MRVLVSGGCGFIDSCFVRHAVKEVVDIMNVDAMTYVSSQRSLAAIAYYKNYSLKESISETSWVQEELSNLSIVNYVCKILDKRNPIKEHAGSCKDRLEFIEDRPEHDSRYAIDSTRIREELGWREFISLQQALEKTIEWYLDNEVGRIPLFTGGEVGKRLGEKL